MRNLDLATLGVEEMNETELQNVAGGWGWESLLILTPFGGVYLAYEAAQPIIGAYRKGYYDGAAAK